MTLVPLLSSPSAVGVADVRVVEIVVTRMDGTVAFADTMPVTSDTVTLAPQVTYTPPSEVFTVEIVLKGADGGLLFRGGVQVTLGGDVRSEPVDVPMTYVGPGSDAATVTIDPASGTTPVGESATFTGQGFRSDGTATLGTPLKWASLDPTIASVADEFSGVVQALQPGTARITATAVRLAAGQPSDTALLTVLPALSLVINSVTVTEGDAGTVDAVFTVAQSAASSRTVTVDFATVDGSAVAPADYVANSGTLTFDPGVTSRQVTVTVNGDLLDEGASETFTVVLSGAVNATIQTATGVGTITDDDSPPSLTINNVTVAEGDVGTVAAVFTVTQSAASSQTVTVDFATVDGSAIAPADYAATAGTLTFTPGGPLTQQVTVTVNGDLLDEGASETFTVVLSGAVNATIQTGTGVGTIVDDEGAPSLSIDDVVVTEGDAGTVGAVFTVTQAVPSSQTVTVDFATLDGTAVAPSDYLAHSGTLTFTPGGPLTQQVTVTVNGDLLDEGAFETFTVVLSSAVNGVIATPSGLGTITDDDLPPSLTINDVTVTEGDGGTVDAVFTVTQSAASAQTVTVGFATADGTAIAPADYVGASGQLAFTPGGALTQLVTVTVNGDLLDEGAAETFTVGLSAPSNATILDGTGLGTITDDDLPPSLAIDDVTVVEGNSGVVLADFTVTLSAASGQIVTVDFATSDGSAVAGADYVANSGQLTFTPGDVSETVTVTVNGDLVDEVDETFTVGLTAPSNATIADGSGLGTITDDDAPPLMVTTTSLPDAIEAVAYTAPSLAATGGDGSYTWALAGGSGPLPAGLGLTPSGDVVGTPSTPGSFAFTVQVASGDGQTAQQPLSIDVIAAAVLAPALVDSAIALFECGYSAFGWVGLGHEDVLEPTAGVAQASAVYRATPETGDCDASSSDQSWYDQIMEARTLLSNASGTGVYDRLSNDWNLGVQGEQLMAIAAIYSAAAYDHFGEFYCEMAFDGGTLETPSQVLAQAEQWSDVALVHIATFGDFAMPGAIAASAHNMAYGLRARIRWADGDLAGAAADASQIPQGFTAFVTRDAGPGRRNKIFDAATAVGFGGMLGPNTWWNPAIRSPNPVSGVAWPDPIPFTGYLDLGVSPDGRAVDASGYPVLASEPSAVPDARVQHFNKVIQGPVPRDVPDKYQSESDDIPLVSWREALLIRAEAENNFGNMAGAIALVNQLRTSESLPPVSGAYLASLLDGLDDANEVRYLLLEERRREFFAEGGRYWSTKIQNTDLLWFPRGEGTTPEAGFTLQGGVRLFMPTEEYDLNPNLSSSDRGTGCIGLFGQQQPTGTL